MNPTLVLPATASPPITDDLLMELLNPTDPAMTRMVTSFYLSMGLRHLINLTAEGEGTDATWQADLRASIAALAEVMG